MEIEEREFDGEEESGILGLCFFVLVGIGGGLGLGLATKFRAVIKWRSGNGNTDIPREMQKCRNLQ